MSKCYELFSVAGSPRLWKVDFHGLLKSSQIRSTLLLHLDIDLKPYTMLFKKLQQFSTA